MLRDPVGSYFVSVVWVLGIRKKGMRERNGNWLVEIMTISLYVAIDAVIFSHSRRYTHKNQKNAGIIKDIYSETRQDSGRKLMS